MPLVLSSYRAPHGFSHGHLQSVVPALFRRVRPVTTRRERIETPDRDFLDLDWTPAESSRVVVISHGLEGSSRDGYVQGMARALARRGWQVVAWNCRGCSGELNRQLRFYHSGSSDDLRTVVQHVLGQAWIREVALIGFSLGGNMTLKFLGEEAEAIDPRIVGAVAFSVPCDLAASSIRLEAAENRIYMERFLRSLRQKVRAKAERFPGTMDLGGLHAIRTFRQFDDRFTAPLHGFADAEDYWAKAGSQAFLRRVRIPALLVNARDDPFLAGGCFPVEEAETNPWFFLEMPRSGGHVGFVTWGSDGEYWSETRAAEFLETVALRESG
jgi:predicted alpha/beta-fold hydrolase